MTKQQEELIEKVRSNIWQSRGILDHLRYYMDEEITEKERGLLDDCHSFLCSAYDKIVSV